MARNTSRCRSCGAEIYWIKTVHGKNHPLDAMPDPMGEWVISPTSRADGAMEVMIRATPLNRGEVLYTSHFATCEHADSHRKRGKA